MSGFVYLWRDRLTKKFYLGSHWGRQNDGYVCGSKKMRSEFKARRSDFRRRILSIVSTSSLDLHAEEERWLSMIADHELGARYYNLMKIARGAPQGNKRCVGRVCSPETREKIAAAQRGKIIAAEVREKMRAAKLGKKQTPEFVAKRAASLSGRKRAPEIGRKISAAKMGHRYTTREMAMKMVDARLRKSARSFHDPRQGALL